jgi:hypothetical protein
MRCKHCPASWEDRDYYYGVQDWGCYCDPESGSDCGRELANGDIGCNRKLSYIKKVMKEVEKQKQIEEQYIVKQMRDMAKFFSEVEK